MILDEKTLMYPPPPPYSTPTSAQRKSFSSLPAHILLEIIADVFPTESDTAHLLRPGASPYDPRLYEPTNPEEQRKVLFWLSTSLRLVNRQLYAACMYILRSTYLQAYQSLIRPPYTSDPFPLSDPSSLASSNTNSHDPSSSPTPPAYASTTSFASVSSSATAHPNVNQSPFHNLPRETPILDRFIALKVRHDVLADESELHGDREDAFRDVFDVAQPRARLEDLVRVYGVREGVVSVPRETPGIGKGQGSADSSSASLPNSPTSQHSHHRHHSHQQQQPQAKKRTPISAFFSFKKSSPTPPVSSSSSSSTRTQRKQIDPLPFASLSVSFSPRKVGLVYNRTKTIAEITREGPRRETLEVLARRLVAELRVVLEED